ncbi:MAG TPA: molybdopterin-dependent oxidoreductase, partial [Acidimicrobiales bacterium]|nr:molybdopterin-dependent oxidoreductase [Acidimicrobiales bacterium]
ADGAHPLLHHRQLDGDAGPEVLMGSMVCGFCSVGCSLDVNVTDGVAVSLTPTKDYPVNLGMACPKGWEALTPLRAPDRATTPLLRRSKDEPLAPVDWPTALEAMVGRFKAVQAAHGPEAVAYISTGQIASEEMALLGAIAKFGMGMVHGDGNTRQCMATAVVAYKEAFGFDAPPYTYADLEESDVIVLWGANPCIAHPILWERICRNPHHPEVIVVDPRVTETAAAATQHYPLLPKSDLTLAYGLAHLLIAWGAGDKDFVEASTEGFDDFAAHVEAFTPERVSAATGLPVDALELMADTIASGKRVSFWWTMGVNQSHEGVRLAQALIDLALLTGSIGRPGTGANSITGQCNAMGSRLWSNTTNLLGGRAFTDPVHRAEVAELLKLDVSRIPDRPSWAYDQIVDGIREGTIKALWIVATNTAHSWIHQSEVRDLLGRLDCLVVQDLYPTTETAQLADIVLPAAGWGEKEGTFINSERRYGRIRRVVRAPGQALADFSIFKLVADAWGCGEMFEEWSSPEAVFRILQRLSAGRPCDISGIGGYEEIEESGGIQWPCPPARLAGGAGVPAGSGGRGPEDPGARHKEQRLYEDGRFFHPDGKARFVWEEPRPVAEPTSDEYPYILLTGRGSSSQWHTQTRTSKSAILRTLYPTQPYVEISPADAAALGVAADEWVLVASPRGEMEARAYVTPTVAPGQVFVPMHYAATNRLTRPSFDPYSRQPSYKSAAVDVRRLAGSRRYS